jgi:hypothetical protein
MSEGMPVHEGHHEDAIEHLEEEIARLEGVTRWGRPIRIATLVICLVAAVAGLAWFVVSPPPITSGRASATSSTGSPIELMEPRPTTLSEPPARFAWESVTGRLQYVVRIYVKGSTSPVLEKLTTNSSIDLTPDETARMPRGKRFVWTVVAQAKNGSTLGTGESSFKVK